MALKFTSMAALALLATLQLPAAFAQNNAAAQAPQPPSYAALQQQLLEAQKKANEQALEQIKTQAAEAVKASSDAVAQAAKAATETANQNEQVLKTLAAVSEKTIKTAQESNAFAETILKIWTGGLALVVAIFGFFGWKEFKNIRQSFDAAVAQIKAEGAAEVKGAMEEAKRSMAKLLEDARVEALEKGRIARLLTIDLGGFVIDDEIRKSPPDKQDRLLIEELFKRLAIMEAYAITLEDTRTQCWIHGQRALLHYFTGDYRKAWENQERAFPLSVEITQFHVHQNLACFTSKVFETHNEPTALSRSREVLLLLVGYVVPQQAKELVEDKDLAAVLNAAADVKTRLETIANRLPGH